MRSCVAQSTALILFASWLVALPSAISADAWPDFRGPHGDGRADHTDAPLTWSESQNVRWKTEIPGKGWSSPVVLGNAVWLTTATEDGKTLSAIGIDRATGKLVHNVKVFEIAEPEPINEVNSYASPSPVIEPGRLYAYFGTYGIAAVDTESGKVVWSRQDLKLNHKEGPGSSPVLFGDLVIFHCDGMDVQFVIALNKKTGETAWKTNRSFDYSTVRDDFRKAYGTPLVGEFEGKPILVSNGAHMVGGYDPLTGKELWRVRYEGFSNVARPVLFGDHAIINTGYLKPEIWSIRLGGSGDVTESNVAWKFSRGVPAKPSALVANDLVFFVNDKGGVVTCIDARAGTEKWTERLGGNYSASPIAVGERIYFFDQEGKATVIRAAAKFEKLATNSLEDGCMASPAVAGGALFVRTRKHLYKIEQPKTLRAGAATSNITPNIGGDIIGGFHPIHSTHIHDDLHARCLVIDNGQTKVAFVVCDLLGVSRQVCDEARRLVAEETDIPGKQVVMSGTHTHSATSALGDNRFKYSQELGDYQKFVARRIADGVRRANNNLEPATIGWASANEPSEVFNRRWFMKPGTVPPNPFGEIDQVKMNPPRASPNLVEPAGPTDPEVFVLAVRNASGAPIAALMNYSLHYVGGVPDGHISADYFPLVCERVKQLLGADRSEPPFVGLLSNGTSGNINNIDFRKPGERMPPYAKMRQVADVVANAAFEAMKKIEYRDWVPLGGELRELPVATRRPTTQQLERAKSILDARNKDGHVATLEEIYAERTIRMHEYPEQITLPIQALRVGDVGVSAIPCEVFVEIGLELKASSPLKPAFTMSIANGYFGYLPTPEHHRLGGYETWLGTNRVEEQASVKIVAALLEMLAGLR